MDQQNDEPINPQGRIKKEVIKHSAAIHMKNSINLLQRRTWNVLLANAFNELMEKRTHRILVKDLQNMLSYDSNDDAHLKSAIEGLIGCVVTWNILEKDKKSGWAATSLLAQAEVKDGFCTYAYSDLLKDKLFNPSMYARICLNLQNKFTSKHSLALYELCLDYFDSSRGMGETPKILIATFRELMGVGEAQYLIFNDFNKRIIKIAVDEVNELSDLEISVQFFRENRRIAALKFYIKKKKNFPRLLSAGVAAEKPEGNEGENTSNSEDDLNLVKLVAILRVKTAMLRSIIASALVKYDFEYVRSNILYANEHAETNYTLYLKNSLKNDWAQEKRQESVFEDLKSQQELVRGIEKLAEEQLSGGLPERFRNLEAENRQNLLQRAKKIVLENKHKDFLLRDENRGLLDKAILGIAIRIKEMKI
jgi:hypothetical protein